MSSEAQIQRKRPSTLWNIANAAVTIRNQASISKSEQELHVWIERDGTAHITCTHLRWITKLRHNPLFSVQQLIKNPAGRVLQVQGKLPENLITLRKKERKLRQD